MVVMALRTDGNQRYNWMKNRRSLFVNWTRPPIFRCSTISCCLSAAFSASSRLMDLKIEPPRLKRKNISAAIAADVKRFYQQIKTDGRFRYTQVRRNTLARTWESSHRHLRITPGEWDAFKDGGQVVPGERAGRADPPELSNRIFKSFDDIVDHCCYAWNTLIDQPWKIMSIARRDWAAVGHSIGGLVLRPTIALLTSWTCRSQAGV